ncbi:M20 family metallopeptidase [Virgibacillus sp. W0181]|uniref:M20 family metallopeptidase n=1 Tax=Virgibacillus sp. W0181 TaxID=3391581 RepID=UPI003F456BD5
MDNESTKKIAAMISEEEVVEVTEKLIEIESHKESAQKESAVAYWIRDFFISHGIEAWTEEVFPNRPNVYARMGQAKNTHKSVMLNGHIDTVPAYTMNQAFKPERHDGNLYGRGAVDMKGALAAMMVSMVTLKRLNMSVDGEVIFAGVIDEEERAQGAKQVIDSGKLTADFAVIGEPTALQIMPAHKGMEWIEVAFYGKSAHGSMPDSGKNAIYHATEFTELLRKHLLPLLKERRHPILGIPTLNLGKITGGLDPNVVADQCFLQFDRRWLPNESTESIMEELQSIVSMQKKNNPNLRVEIRRMSELTGYHPPLDTSFDHWGVKVLEEGTKEMLDQEPIVDMFPGWSDGATLANGGIPSVVCGPGELEDAHSDKEKINMKELRRATQLYTYVVLEITRRRRSFESAQ